MIGGFMTKKIYVAMSCLALDLFETCLFLYRSKSQPQKIIKNRRLILFTDYLCVILYNIFKSKNVYANINNYHILIFKHIWSPPASFVLIVNENNKFWRVTREK